LRLRGKKIRTKIETDEYFDWAFEHFSGYIVVDNREYKRLTYRVLDHDPTHDDIRELFRSFQGILKKRDLELRGITTDGSHLYPEPIAEIFPDVRHQLREFHVKKEINKSVLKAVTQARRELEKTKTKRNKRGRPTSKEDKQTVRKNNRIKEKIADLFENRYLFVQKVLTSKERETLHDITKGLPELRTLREIVDVELKRPSKNCENSGCV
jgi:transposase